MKNLILGLALLITSAANAAVVNFDETTSTRLDSEYLITGTNTHLDTTTGLEWLDFGTHDGDGVTFGYSINETVSFYDEYGFRLATETEVSDLFSFFYTDFADSGNGTMSVTEDPNSLIIQERNSWLVGFGTHEQTSGSEFGQQLFSTGLYQDDDGTVQLAGFKIFLDPTVTTAFYSTEFTFSGLDRDSAYANLGVFMVRDTGRGLCNPNIEECDISPVPIPAAFWLFGSGLIGLFVMAWRKT